MELYIHMCPNTTFAIKLFHLIWHLFPCDNLANIMRVSSLCYQCTKIKKLKCLCCCSGLLWICARNNTRHSSALAARFTNGGKEYFFFEKLIDFFFFLKFQEVLFLGRINGLVFLLQKNVSDRAQYNDLQSLLCATLQVRRSKQSFYWCSWSRYQET